MSRPHRQIGQIMTKLAWALALASPFVTHLALVTGRHRLLAGGLAAVQVVVVARVALARVTGARRRWVLAGAGLLLGLALLRTAGQGVLARPGLVATAGLSHAALNLSLLALFGHSLQPGHTPLATAMARRLRGTLSPQVAAYTRGVTWLWCGVFALQLATSAALLLLAPVAAWSLFVNVLNAPLVLLVFAGEYAVRKVWLRHEPHTSPLAMMRRFGRLAPDAP